MGIRYQITICWSDDDGAYIAEVPDLPGCVADGRTYQEALAAAEIAIEEWIDSAHDLGRAIPVPRPRRVSGCSPALSASRSSRDLLGSPGGPDRLVPCLSADARPAARVRRASGPTRHQSYSGELP